MPQSSAIFAALTIGFLVLIVQRGELATYANLLLGNAGTDATANPAVQAQSSQNGIGVSSAVSSILGQSSTTSPFGTGSGQADVNAFGLNTLSNFLLGY